MEGACNGCNRSGTCCAEFAGGWQLRTTPDRTEIRRQDRGQWAPGSGRKRFRLRERADNVAIFAEDAMIQPKLSP
jgi:hypothetical protein